MAHESIVELTPDNFDTEVIKAGVPVLVDFWAEWCGPCKMLSPVLDELAAEKGESVKIGKVNIDENPELAVEYKVNSIPTLLFFKDGEMMEQRLGIIPKEQIAHTLDALN